jgi:MoaA/NifB/PqqE/SkfB family radical SAM enzyme
MGIQTNHGGTAPVTYVSGWYEEESDGVRSFRWMRARGCCRAARPGALGAGWLRLTGGLGRPVTTGATLSAWVNGQLAGRVQPGVETSHHLFPIEIADHLDVVFELDPVLPVEGDPRELGLMVRAVEVFSDQEDVSAFDAEGWYDWEHDDYFPFRWMSRQARLVLPRPVLDRGRFASLPIFSPLAGPQVLSINGPGGIGTSLALQPGWFVYDIPMADAGASAGQGAGRAELRLSVNELFPAEDHPTDVRELGVAVGELDVHDDPRRHEHACALVAGMSCRPEERHAARTGPAASPAEFRLLPDGGDGWYGLESDEQGSFRWMSLEARIRVGAAAAGARYCVVPVFSSYHNLAQQLTVLADDHVVATLTLMRRWNAYSVALPGSLQAGALTLTFRLDRLVPPASHPGDDRDLGARVGTLLFHADEERHERDRSLQENNTLRYREMQAGATVLSSRPSTLGIDLFGKCNIKPACVYCPWDRMKALEGANTNATIDDGTLESYGSFFRCAESLVNCSFGEPLLHPRLEQVLQLVAHRHQTIELSTNGQAFSARTVRALAGAPVFLYVSLDAASAATYARLRNDHWHEIIAGLLALRDARHRAGGWPRLNMVFIPMRANVDDLPAYFRLCRLVEADALVLRPLLMEESQVDTERGGYRYVYEQEHLGPDDLAELVADCRRLSARYRVPVMTQFDFGKVDFGTVDPVAAEPEGRR